MQFETFYSDENTKSSPFVTYGGQYGAEVWENPNAVGASDLLIPGNEWVQDIKRTVDGYVNAARDIYKQPHLDDYGLIQRISPRTAQRMRESDVFRGQQSAMMWFWDKVHAGDWKVPRQWLNEWKRDLTLWVNAHGQPKFSEGESKLTDTLEEFGKLALLGFVAYKVITAK